MIGRAGHSKDVKNHAGVRQGCVLNPKYFAVLRQHAMCKWKNQHFNSSWDLHDGLANVLDLRFADDFQLVSLSAHEAVTL